MSYGQKLREWRKSQRLTQAGFGQKIGFSDKFVSQHEREDGQPSERFLQKSAEFMGITYEELIAPAGQRLNDSAQVPSKVSRQMHEENLNDYRAALHWLAAHLDDAHLQKLRDAAWNEQDAAVPRAVKLLVFDALVASRERQHKKSIPKN